MPQLFLSRQGHCINDVSEWCLVAGHAQRTIMRHGRRTVRGHTRSPHFSMAIISVTVQLWT